MMKWSIIQLQKSRDNGLLIDEMVDMSRLEARDTQIRHLPPVHVTGRADVGSDKVTFHLDVKGTMILPCSRTLVDVEYPFQFSLLETFIVKASSFGDYEENEDVHLVEGDVVDLNPVLEEEILLEVPMQVISEEADEHTIATGKGWELQSEEQASVKEDKVDPRLAGLADFFKSDKN